MNRVKHENLTPSPSPAPSPAPQGGYTDFLLRSSAPSSLTGWRHNLMKFAALGDRVVDPNGEPFVQPVKLNRKDPRTVRRLTEEERESFNKAAIAAAAGVDAMDIDEALVKDENGDVKPVKKIREEIDLSLVGTGKSGLAPAVRTKSNMFKKKTKRVFVSSEEARRLKREEWMPWVLEDVHGNERWIGKLEGGAGEGSAGARGPDGAGTAASKRAAADKNGTGMKGWRPDAPTGGESGGGGSSYVAFVFGENGDDFKIVPVNRWYKFSRGPRYATLGTEEAEDEYNRQQKAQDAEGRWMMHKRTTVASQKVTAANPASGASTPVPSSSKPAKPLSKAAKATTAPAPAPPANIRSRLLDKSVLSGRRTSTGTGGARKKLRSVIKGTSGGNDDDELSGRRGKEEGGEQGDDEFEYDEDFQDDEEGVAKVNDMADEDETKELENRIKKEMRSAKGFEEVVDDPDDEEEEELTNTGKAVKKLVKKLAKNQAYESDGEDDDNPYASASEYDDDDNASVASLDLNGDAKAAGTSLHRSTSQQGSSRPSQSGRTHSTSNSRHPSRPTSRSGTPVPSGSAVVAMRATSPSRRTSAPGSRGVSPGPGIKRKRPDDDSDGGKRQKSEGGLLTEDDLVALLRTKPVFTTKEVLHHFRKAFKVEPRNKLHIGTLLQAVANLVGGELQLKPGFA